MIQVSRTYKKRMASLSSFNTDAEVWEAFDDNASYEEDSSASKARKFITACRILLRRRPSSMSVDGRQITFNQEIINGEMARARSWLTANEASSVGSVRYLDVSGVRD